MTEKEKNSDDLPTSFILFCKCGHSLYCHDPDRVPVCNYDATSDLDKGRYECKCTGFVNREN